MTRPESTTIGTGMLSGRDRKRGEGEGKSGNRLKKKGGGSAGKHEGPVPMVWKVERVGGGGEGEGGVWGERGVMRTRNGTFTEWGGREVKVMTRTLNNLASQITGEKRTRSVVEVVQTRGRKTQ